MIQGNYVSFFKTRVPTRWRRAPAHPGQGRGIHSGPSNGHTECEARVPAGRGRAVSDRIFGSLKPGYQRWIGKIRSMEFKLIPLGSGPQGPGQFRMILKKLQATSGKLQATSNKRLTDPDSGTIKDLESRKL